MTEKADFLNKYAERKPQVLWLKSINDTDTPVSAFLKLAGDKKNAFLLESVEGGENLGRYSIIGYAPDKVWKAKDDQITINGHEQPNAPNQPTLEHLNKFIAQSKIDLPSEVAPLLPPMFAGVFGFFGYDLVHEIDSIPLNKPNDLQVDDAVFIRPTILAVFDNVKREIFFITPVRHDPEVSAETAYNDAIKRLESASNGLNKAVPNLDTDCRSFEEPSFSSNMQEAEYRSIAERAKEYIAAGDIFQVVLSQRFSAEYSLHPFTFYRSLRRLNPSPFLFFLNFDDYALVGSSPEILVRVRDREVCIRPIAGTRPRGKTPQEDLALEEELLQDPKELAEHLMLLDLGRNDVGRSSKLGTVQVGQQHIVERYSHVMHIVSNVTGQLADDQDAISALKNGFPAGTVSGAPKIRAMEIISELETDRRGPYAGCIGYFSADGNMDTCIALRTALIKDGKIHVQSGAGIVADSNSYAEHQECLNKASALMTAAKLSIETAK